MDEPTNDLDVETLELLEELLAGYAGTLLLVSHDRDFLDNVVTSTLALEGGGHVGEYVGGYSDWLRQRGSGKADGGKGGGGIFPSSMPEVAEGESGKIPPSPVSKRKLSYKESRELEELPGRIDVLETRIAAIGVAMQAPGFYQQDGARIVAQNNELSALQLELDAAYARWTELDA